MSSYTLGLSQELQQNLQDQSPSMQGTSVTEQEEEMPPPSQQQQQETTKRKKLPIIVDVALDANGKQLYQIHESSKLVRKEMPRSTNFNLHHELTPEELSFIQNGGDTVCASAKLLNKHSDPLGKSQQGDYYTHSSEDRDILVFNEGEGVRALNTEFQGAADLQNVNKLNHEEASRVEDTDIWSDDVEQAFEEVLTFIPKNGLNKIKIAGRSCGRNELISDYIYTKTGKFRTRKQVSSHIQVIKNLGQNQKIINLINDGPSCNNEEEHTKIMQKFESVFSKINLSKSLGFNNSVKRKLVSSSGGDGSVRSTLNHAPATKRRRKSHASSDTTLPELEIGNFYMSINNHNSNSVLLTIQKNSFNKYGILKHLKLNDNSTISHRFPGMSEFENCPNIPVLHNMARIYLPEDFSPKLYDVGSGFSANYNLKCKDYLTASSSSSRVKSKLFSIFTCIYSYGQEVSKHRQSGIQLNQECKFVTNFWKPFIRFVLMGKLAHDIAVALRGLSIKQIVYETSGSGRESNNDSDDSAVLQDEDLFMVLKSRVKLVLLWEFLQVYDIAQAITTTTKIILPGGVNNDHLVTADENIVPQIVTYNDPNRAIGEEADDAYASYFEETGAGDYDAEANPVQVGSSMHPNLRPGRITATTSVPTPYRERFEDFNTATTVPTTTNATATTATTASTTRPFPNKLPISNPEYVPELRYSPHFIAGNDLHSQQPQQQPQQQLQQGLDAGPLQNPLPPPPPPPPLPVNHHFHHPDYEIQMQQQVPAHYHHPHHPGYKLHQSANMDLMMVPSGPVHLEPVASFQEYSYTNQGYIQGYASDY